MTVQLEEDHISATCFQKKHLPGADEMRPECLCHTVMLHNTMLCKTQMQHISTNTSLPCIKHGGGRVMSGAHFAGPE